ncbi:DUF4913 domain-containing protein [Micromonospora sp. NPDC050397]|uniref:DUF4913 domain-containing protein n=1 Tax=Micromonospora sp. NPDC050397 TaxID=3364279 RepID=UPI003850C7B3
MNSVELLGAVEKQVTRTRVTGRTLEELMTASDGVDVRSGPEAEAGAQQDVPADPAQPFFILYLPETQFLAELDLLAQWVHGLLLPAYGAEPTSNEPWCPQWWQHLTAVAQLHGLWLAWQDLTGPDADRVGPAMWHRDYLHPLMAVLRSPEGPFAGCRAGMHRPKQPPPIEPLNPVQA